MEKIKASFSQILAKLKLHLVFQKKPLWHGGILAYLIIVIAVLFSIRYVNAYLNITTPTISLVVPKENDVAYNNDLYIRGVVLPSGSKVLINGQPVSLNGDGTFTAVVKISEGQNVLKVAAENGRKHAEFLRLIRRELSEDEKRIKQEADAKEAAELKAKTLSKDQEIAQVQAAYTQREAKKVRVIEHALKEERGIKRVIGKLVNDTDNPAYWVKVTAAFLDKQGGKIEEKLAFVTSFDKFLKPGEEAPFETQASEKTFDHYQLDVSWEKE